MKHLLIKSLKIFSAVWFTLAMLFIGFGYASTWYFEGFSKLQEVMSPFNMYNNIMIFITMSPALGAMYWRYNLEKATGKDL